MARLNIDDMRAPLPLLILVHEHAGESFFLGAVREKNFYQRTLEVEATSGWQEWVVNDGVVNEKDGGSCAFNLEASMQCHRPLRVKFLQVLDLRSHSRSCGTAVHNASTKLARSFPPRSLISSLLSWTSPPLSQRLHDIHVNTDEAEGIHKWTSTVRKKMSRAYPSKRLSSPGKRTN
jgi:hypothetical protein